MNLALFMRLLPTATAGNVTDCLPWYKGLRFTSSSTAENKQKCGSPTRKLWSDRDGVRAAIAAHDACCGLCGEQKNVKTVLRLEGSVRCDAACALALRARRGREALDDLATAAFSYEGAPQNPKTPKN